MQTTNGESLPLDTRDFLDRVEDAFSDWNCTVRDTDEVMRELYVHGARKPDSRPNWPARPVRAWPPGQSGGLFAPCAEKIATQICSPERSSEGSPTGSKRR
jgi:hypothetical protein